MSNGLPPFVTLGLVEVVEVLLLLLTGSEEAAEGGGGGVSVVVLLVLLVWLLLLVVVDREAWSVEEAVVPSVEVRDEGSSFWLLVLEVVAAVVVVVWSVGVEV